MARIVPSERFRRELDELIDAGSGVDVVEGIARAGARMVLQQALEDGVGELLGRARYERVGEPVAHRNGYEPRTAVTTSGRVELERPRVRDAGRLEFESALLGRGVARTHALEALVIWSLLRGLSVRDVEAALEECFGEQVIGKSRECRRNRVRHERTGASCPRRTTAASRSWRAAPALSGASPEGERSLTPTARSSPAGITLEGRKVLLGLALGSRESYDSWWASDVTWPSAGCARRR